MSWNLTVNRLFSQDKSFFVTEKSECSGWICENFTHFDSLHSFWVTKHIWLVLDWTIYSWWRLQLIRMSSYAKNKLQMCSVTQHQCRRRQMWGKFSANSPRYTHFLSVTKNDLSWLNNLFTVRFQLIRMSSYAKNKLQMCSVTQHQCRRRQMWGNFHKFTQTLTFSVTKNDLSWLNNLFTVRFQLIRMSSYAKNKLQMCSVTQHQCRRRQMLGKFSQIHPEHSLFLLQKMTCLDWTIYSR